MNLTNSQRVIKLAGSLARNPHHVPDYIRYHSWRRRLPVDFAMPWWSFAAIEEVHAFSNPDHDVFEYGTGGSTLFFASRCRSVLSVEDDAEWLGLVKSRLIEKHMTNADVVHEAFDFKNPAGFTESRYLHRLGGLERYDIIVIDGQDWSFAERPVCFYHAEQFIKPGGLIVVDDSWRYVALRTKNRAKSVKVCEGIGPCRVGVTSTDLYFY